MLPAAGEAYIDPQKLVRYGLDPPRTIAFLVVPRQGLEPGLDPRGDQRLEVDVEVLR